MPNKQVHFNYNKPNYSKGFHSENKYAAQRNREYEDLEDEIEALEKEEGGDPESVEVEEPKQAETQLSADEGNYKKRYSDLRSYSSKRENELKSEIDNLKSKVEELEKSNIQYPTTEEEYAEWVETYPKVAAAMQTMVLKNTEGLKEQFTKQTRELEQEKQRIALDRSFNKLIGIHPDFLEIRKTEEWANWLNKQSRLFQKAIKEPSLDDSGVEDAAAVISRYKSESGLSKKKDTLKDAAQKVSSSNTSAPQDGKKKQWKESEVESMSDRDYAKYEEDIQAAMQEGNFVYDISGSAR